MNADEPAASPAANGSFAKMRELFDRARDLPTEDRTAFLEPQCAGDHGLLAVVRQLLEASDNVGDKFDPDRGGLAGAVLNAGRSPCHPEQIGPYRIRREIGRGGMGVVYLAEQSNPQREVALKILNGGRYAGALQSRFSRVVRVLGRLEHPGITRIYEAGMAETDAGPLSYFAMEYVRGSGLTEYAEQAKLPIAARVELVAKIADAVQHAHTKGVIHRDLKPANILMDEETTGAWEPLNGDSGSRSGARGPQPKILDFGVARLLEPDTQRTAITEAGLLIGTVSYMSPEQLGGDTDAVDARTDVYAMGTTFDTNTCLDLMWQRRDELAPPGRKRRAAFFANYARACAVVGQRGTLDQAVQVATDALSYAPEPDVATELVAAARTMLARATDQPPPAQ